MKRLGIVCLAGLVGAFVAAACGGDDGNDLFKAAPDAGQDASGATGGSAGGGAGGAAGGGASGTSGTGGGAGSGGGCTGAADCDDGNACTTDVCDLLSGDCENNPLNGVPAPDSEQTDGDCQRILCMGGAPQAVNDVNDLPDDGNQCTVDACTSAVPMNIPRALGTTCSQDGGRFCNGDLASPACVECNVASDCTMLPPDDECQTRTCTDGVCGQTFTNANTPVTVQQTGDCQVVVCDGMGGTRSNADNTDLPVDGLECTEDVCTTGTPSNPPVSQNTPCGASGLCDGSGNCVGCNAPSDCGASTFCQAQTCISNVCGVSNTAPGTPLPPGSQTPHDCLELQCDGNGQVQSVADDGDTPNDDGNQCTDDECNAGVEVHPPKNLDEPCSQSGGTVCDGAGACVECNSASQCLGSVPLCQFPVCTSNSCGLDNSPPGTPAPPGSQTPGDCMLVVCDGSGGTTSQVQNGDIPIDGNECTGDVCTAGVPSNPPLAPESPCTANPGWVCNGLGACVECATNNQCSPPDSCDTTTWTCGCVPLSCLDLGLTCGSGASGCGTPLNCDNGMQDGTESDVDCGGMPSACARRCEVGDQCNSSLDCENMNCVDGYCCDAPCNAECEACNLPGNEGMCTGEAQGTPCPEGDGECTQGFCDMNRNCQAVPANEGGSCNTVPCLPGQMCSSGVCKVVCVGGDSCCPPGCTSADDSDCP